MQDHGPLFRLFPFLMRSGSRQSYSEQINMLCAVQGRLAHYEKLLFQYFQSTNEVALLYNVKIMWTFRFYTYKSIVLVFNSGSIVRTVLGVLCTVKSYVVLHVQFTPVWVRTKSLFFCTYVSTLYIGPGQLPGQFLFTGGIWGWGLGFRQLVLYLTILSCTTQLNHQRVFCPQVGYFGGISKVHRRYPQLCTRSELDVRLVTRLLRLSLIN